MAKKERNSRSIVGEVTLPTPTYNKVDGIRSKDKHKFIFYLLHILNKIRFNFTINF